MDNRAIGIFDSGLGGLTAVAELIKIMPNEDLVYFGDTGRVPYGTRSVEIITKYAKQDIKFLQSKNVKLIIAACGTVSSAVLPNIRDDYDIRVVGVVESAADAALKATKNNKIGVIGTGATVKSGVYTRTINENNSSAQVFEYACPLFVPLVENGFIDRDNQISKLVAAEYLKPFKEKGIDTLILGCTHFPMLAEIIDDYFEHKVTLINSGAEVVKSVKDILAQDGISADAGKTGEHHFYVSDSVNDFSHMAEMILKRNDFKNIERVTVDSL